MPAYAYRCPHCGDPEEVRVGFNEVYSTPICPEHGLMGRDYREERVNIGPAVGTIQRDHKAADQRDLFLPTRKDFESPSDPTGERGVKDWNDRHDNDAKGSGKYRPR